MAARVPGAGGSPQQSMDERLAAYRDTSLAADSAAFTSRPVDAMLQKPRFQALFFFFGVVPGAYGSTLK